MHNASECCTAVSGTAGRRAAAARAAGRAAESAIRFTRTPPWGRINSAPIIGRDSFIEDVQGGGLPSYTYDNRRMGRLMVYVACAASLALGLFFIFVWAPHPWAWEGFDGYHDLGLSVARGESFPTLDYPWGYAY